MKRLARIAAFGFVTLMPQQAMAFDCAKAASDVEKTICAEPELKALDDRMGESYATLRAGFDPAARKMLVRSQKRWLQWRESCQTAEGVSDCVRRETEGRIRQFRGEAESGPGVGGEIVPQFIAQDGTAEAYDLDIAVMRYKEPRSKAEKRFNAIADGIVADVILGPHGKDTGGSVYAQKDLMSISYASPLLMSVKNSFYLNQGGAHGDGGSENFNIDMRTGKLLEIGDMITEEGAADLRSGCKEQIKKEKLKRLGESDADYNPDTDDFLKDDVIAEHVATAGRWTIRESEVTISFDAYAIGSYAEGQYECRFAMDEIREMAVGRAPLP
jgi:uncharacterized protein YecT (DUF1311 family)